jgi:hypothetical protein
MTPIGGEPGRQTPVVVATAVLVGGGAAGQTRRPLRERECSQHNALSQPPGPRLRPGPAAHPDISETQDASYGVGGSFCAKGCVGAIRPVRM